MLQIECHLESSKGAASRPSTQQKFHWVGLMRIQEYRVVAPCDSQKWCQAFVTSSRCGRLFRSTSRTVLFHFDVILAERFRPVSQVRCLGVKKRNTFPLSGVGAEKAFFLQASRLVSEVLQDTAYDTEATRKKGTVPKISLFSHGLREQSPLFHTISSIWASLVTMQICDSSHSVLARYLKGTLCTSKPSSKSRGLPCFLNDVAFLSNLVKKFLAKVFASVADHGCFRHSCSIVHSVFCQFEDGGRLSHGFQTKINEAFPRFEVFCNTGSGHDALCFTSRL